jgi:hypothetical protein
MRLLNDKAYTRVYDLCCHFEQKKKKDGGGGDCVRWRIQKEKEDKVVGYGGEGEYGVSRDVHFPNFQSTHVITVSVHLENLFSVV